MSARREVRACAMQALFVLDADRAADEKRVQDTIAAGGSPGSPAEQREGLELACRAWERRADADAAIGALSLDWPVHRQAGVDRSLLRLGWYELAVAGLPAGRVINDIVEIAKEYSSEKSAAFVNAILDQVAKGGAAAPAASPAGSPEGSPGGSPEGSPGGSPEEAV